MARLHSRHTRLSLVDQVEPVSDEEAIETARRLAREEAFSRAFQRGAAAVAVRLPARAFAGKTSWPFLPDSGER